MATRTETRIWRLKRHIDRQFEKSGKQEIRLFIQPPLTQDEIAALRRHYRQVSRGHLGNVRIAR